MMRTRDIVRIAMCAAMLIGGQLVLSSISGVEIVTAMLLCFCYTYGVRDGIAIATTFSLLRCLLFGFQPNVIVLYLIYYNLFACFFGWLGTRLTDRTTIFKTILVVSSAMLFTVCFTLLDDILTPLLYGFSKKAAQAYFFASLSAVIPQTICTLITVSVCFHPLTKALKSVRFS